ncbi:MAG: hypothetical protein OK438_01525 [Thaumarchaeota archaeon]|nr:hypothetical protein [Nitrososphaerota archaeon]
MKLRHPPSTQLLRPLLDMYRSSAVALTGCRSLGLERGSCEFDVIVVTPEKRPPRSTRVSGVHVDLYFIDEKEVMRPSNPEHAVSMANAIAVKDASLVLSTSFASNSALLANSSRRSSRARLGSSLKALGRVDDALSKGLVPDADFWLLSASYDFAYALLYSRERMPAPSHLLGQLKSQSKGLAKNFEAFSRGAGLEKASRASCSARLEALEVLHDVLGRAQGGGGASHSAWTKERLDIVRSKAAELSRLIDHAEAYSFLGQEVLKALMAIAWREESEGKRRAKSPMLMSVLAAEKEGLLSARLLRELGIPRQKASVEGSLVLLRDHVSRLEKWV